MKFAIFALCMSGPASAFAAGAASWACVSNQPGVSAEYEVSMFNEIVTTKETDDAGAATSNVFYTDEVGPTLNGKKLFRQADPKQEGLHELKGSVPQTLEEVEVRDGKKHDLAFQFAGAVFICERQ